MESYPRVASFRSPTDLAGRLADLGVPLPCDEAILTAPASPLAEPLTLPWQGGTRTLANRFAVQPMEGWDGERDGTPSELTRRRWLRFGASGAALIWGCEAVAVLPEARANPNQLMLNAHTAGALARLRGDMVAAHRERFGAQPAPVVGVQLTHSGRFSQPNVKLLPEPVIAYRHPILDVRLRAVPEPISDAEVARIVAAFGEAARLAQEAGFDFVDLKHCHGYLAHEFLSAVDRPGAYGGSFENRTRLLRELIAVVRERAPGLEIGVRLSAFDVIPFAKDPETGVGRQVPVPVQMTGAYRYGFGVDSFEEPKKLLELLASLGVRLVNVTGSSPYYAPHVQRPALFPPSDGYQPPEDPLVGAARLLGAARTLKQAFPETVIVSTGWTYLQNYLPQFAQAAVRAGWCDVVGLGRMMLSYPELPADVLERGKLDAKRLCRTFSDCTTGPRQGLVSGCYPLDHFYKERPEAATVKAVKLQLAKSERA